MPSLPSPKRGRQRIPPLPQFTVLIDREDGTHWTLSHAVSEGTTYIAINSTGTQREPLPEWLDVVTYEAVDGVDLGRSVRLFVRGGRLGYEIIDAEIQDPKPITRRGVAKEGYEVLIPTSWRDFPDELGWEDVSIVG